MTERPISKTVFPRPFFCFQGSEFAGSSSETNPKARSTAISFVGVGQYRRERQSLP